MPSPNRRFRTPTRTSAFDSSALLRADSTLGTPSVLAALRAAPPPPIDRDVLRAWQRLHVAAAAGVDAQRRRWLTQQLCWQLARLRTFHAFDVWYDCCGGRTAELAMAAERVRAFLDERAANAGFGRWLVRQQLHLRRVSIGARLAFETDRRRRARGLERLRAAASVRAAIERSTERTLRRRLGVAMRTLQPRLAFAALASRARARVRHARLEAFVEAMLGAQRREVTRHHTLLVVERAARRSREGVLLRALLLWRAWQHALATRRRTVTPWAVRAWLERMLEAWEAWRGLLEQEVLVGGPRRDAGEHVRRATERRALVAGVAALRARCAAAARLHTAVEADARRAFRRACDALGATSDVAARRHKAAAWHRARALTQALLYWCRNARAALERAHRRDGARRHLGSHPTLRRGWARWRRGGEWARRSEAAPLGKAYCVQIGRIMVYLRTLGLWRRLAHARGVGRSRRATAAAVCCKRAVCTWAEATAEAAWRAAAAPLPRLRTALGRWLQHVLRLRLAHGLTAQLRAMGVVRRYGGGAIRRWQVRSPTIPHDLPRLLMTSHDRP